MTTMTTTDTTPRVWIGCLACYNSGRLVGDWHDAIGAVDVTTADVHGGPSSHDEPLVLRHREHPRAPRDEP